MKNPKITLEEIGIIKRAQAGDESAFNTLFYRYKNFVAHVLFQYLKDMDEAKDITNIVFLKVYNKLSTFTDYSSFGGWLRIIANHTAIDYLREMENKAYPTDVEEQLKPELAVNPFEDNSSDFLTDERLIAEFNKLPEETKRIFKLYYQKGMTVKEVSDALRIPTGTIKSTLSRTRRKIKNNLTN